MCMLRLKKIKKKVVETNLTSQALVLCVCAKHSKHKTVIQIKKRKKYAKIELKQNNKCLPHSKQTKNAKKLS